MNATSQTKNEEPRTRNFPLPLGETEAFHATWQALMQQLDRLLSLAHTHVPCTTEYKESASIARFYLTQLENLAD